jgi:hypothetical protein
MMKRCLKETKFLKRIFDRKKTKKRTTTQPAYLEIPISQYLTKIEKNAEERTIPNSRKKNESTKKKKKQK